jgi:hypothetical protein
MPASAVSYEANSADKTTSARTNEIRAMRRMTGTPYTKHEQPTGTNLAGSAPMDRRLSRFIRGDNGSEYENDRNERHKRDVAHDNPLHETGKDGDEPSDSSAANDAYPKYYRDECIELARAFAFERNEFCL